eukprot:5434903-Pyramimonas_sp.AAC.1
MPRTEPRSRPRHRGLGTPLMGPPSPPKRFAQEVLQRTAPALERALHRLRKVPATGQVPSPRAAEKNGVGHE